MTKWIIPFIALFFLQQTTTPTPIQTPTAAPSKTPTVASTNTSRDTDAETTTIRTFTQEDLTVITGNVQRPNGLTWFNDNLYVACTGDWTIYEINSRSGETRTYIYGTRNAHSVIAEEIDSTTILWVPDFDTNQLMRIDPARSPVAVAGNLSKPWGITTLDETYFAITSLDDNTVYKVNRNNGETEPLISNLRSPTGIATHGGTIYIANSGSNRRGIEWVAYSNEANSEAMTPQPLVSGLQNTTNIVVGPDEMLYFAYSLGTRGIVGRVDPQACQEQGGCTNDQVEIVLYTDLTAPLAGLTIAPDMRLFVHTMFRPEIYWVQLPGQTDSE